MSESLTSKPHAVAPPDCPVSDDQYTRNMLDSLAGWLESRSQTVWAKEYGHDDLMQTYGSFLRRFTARRAEPPDASQQIERLQRAITSAMDLLSNGDTEGGARVLRECFWGTDL